MLPTKTTLGTASAIALVAVLSMTPATAETSTTPATPAQPAQVQPAAPGAQANPPATETKQVSNRTSTQADAKPQYLPPGMMMGPAVMNAYTAERMCDPRASGFSGWRINRFEQALSLTEDQKKKLEDVKTASAKALDEMVSACSTKPVLTPTGQLESMEKRLTAQLDAVKALRATFDPFYASLNDEQKAHLIASGNSWRWQVGEGRGRW